MKSIGASLRTHQQGRTLTLADLWKVTRTDAAVYGFTSLDRDLLYQGVTYQAETAFAASNVDQDTRLSVGNLEISGYFDSAAITQADAEAGLWDGARVELLRVNYADLSQGHEIIATGEVGEVRLLDGRLVAELRGFLQRLQNQQGRVYLPTCDLELGAQGDFKCNVGMAPFTHAGTVTSVADRANFTASGLAQATNYFRFGVVTWTTGSNSGRRMEVKAFTAGGVFALQMPMAGAIAAGDTFTAKAGCDKQLATCRDRFSNVVNFGGFPTVPGLPKMIAEA